VAKKRQELRPDSKGRYIRNIGWVYNPTADVDRSARRYIQPKFYLGRNNHSARVANLRLEQLWDQVCAKHARDQAHGFADDEQPLWDDLTMSMARAVSRNEMSMTVDCPAELAGNDVLYARWLNQLRADFPVLALSPASASSFTQGVEIEQQDAAWHVARSKRIFSEIGSTSSPDSRETLHDALDAYGQHIQETYKAPATEGEQRRLSPWGVTQSKNVERLKQRHPNLPLSQLNLSAIEAMVEVWRQRPLAKGRNRPISPKTAESHIKQLRAFLRWLHRNERFHWRKPEGLDEVKVSVPLTNREKALRLTPAQVETYSLDELTTLYKYGTSLERLLMLLGLNCGFGAAEIGTIRVGEVHLRQAHPHAQLLAYETSHSDSFIKRIRLKTCVYGEHLLWRETVEALDWYKQRRLVQMAAENCSRVRTQSLDAQETLILSDRGQPLAEQTKAGNGCSRIPNAWYAITARIQMDYPDFRKLSFGKLRKTAGNLIKQFSDGEVAGVFLCHGQPVKTDDLLDVYTNRPFARVFAAIGKVERHLAPMFAARSDEFPPEPKRGGPNISIGKIERIRDLRAEGVRPSQIAELVGVSRTTVYRHLPT
jgi:hypothetical protein